MNAILVIQLRRLGDILLTTPVLARLRKRFPKARIDFLCEPAGRAVLENNPNIDRLRLYDRFRPAGEIRDVRREGYDAVLDFMNNPRSALLTGLSGARWRVGFAIGVRRAFFNHAVPVPVEPEYVPLRKIRLLDHWLTRALGQSASEGRVLPELHLSPSEIAEADRWMAG